MPPPVPPPPSFHTTSLLIVLPSLETSLVPPQPVAKGLEAGKSTWPAEPSTPSLEPLSPAAANTLIPRAAADWKDFVIEFISALDQPASGPPQLIETMVG